MGAAAMMVWKCSKCNRIICTGDVAPPRCSIDGWCGDAKPYGVDVPHVGVAGGPDRWDPKGLIERLSKQQMYAPDYVTGHLIALLLATLALHRPTASDGKHGDLHTPTCGCER
jgi:hypothetical protein